MIFVPNPIQKVKNRLILFLIAATLLFSCSKQQQAVAAGQPNAEVKKLSATEFSDKIKQIPDATIVDVRTEEEYKQGHINSAKNIDWNESEFETQIAKLDKSKPVLVYCLSGSRSSNATSYMSKNGFKEIYELDGGIMKWRAANLPEVSDTTVTDQSSAKGMTIEEYESLLKTDKYVLVDFHAPWCGYCKMMEPSLDDIASTMADKVVVVRIDADQNEDIAKHFEIESLPVIMLYKNQQLVKKEVGYQTKKQLLKLLE